MTTNRKIIRGEVKKAILHCVNFAGSNVFTSRARKLDSHEMPAILIYTPDEKVSIYNASPREYRRVCTLKIDIAAEGGDEVEDAIDDYAKLVEQAIIDHDTLGGTVDDIALTSVESECLADGEKTVGGISLSFEVTYYERPEESAAHTDAAPFVTANTVYKPAGSLADSPATSDTVTLDQ